MLHGDMAERCLVVLEQLGGRDPLHVQLNAVVVTPLISFRISDGQLLLSLLLFDESNNVILQVVDNELSFVPDPWDIEFVGNPRNRPTRTANHALPAR